uniref:hypothetical protein n=1 Tax=uncultured Holdemanella sp. TaxID=1763549 RepID=UPI0025FA2074
RKFDIKKALHKRHLEYLRFYNCRTTDHAKHMILHNNRIRLCHTNDEIMIDMDKVIMNYNVHFKDCLTYIECSYEDILMRIYYDDKAIVSLDIDEK